MKTISELCRAHRRTYYFDDGEGLIGVHNHAGVVLWYRWVLGGYSLCGSTATPQSATRKELES